MRSDHNNSRQWVFASLGTLLLCLTLVSTTTGCTNLLRTLVVLLHDPRIKPDYDIEKKKVALITTIDGISTSDASALVMAISF